MKRLTLDRTDPTPPTRPPVWSYTPSQIDSTIAASIETTRQLLTKIVALPTSERTFETVFRPLALREGNASKETEPALFLQYVSTEEAVRDRSVAADKELQVSVGCVLVELDWSLGAHARLIASQEFDLSNVTRLDVYEALLDAKKHTEDHNIALTKEEERLMVRMLRDRARNGLALAPEKREALLEVRETAWRYRVAADHAQPDQQSNHEACR